ncbi:MAG: PilZ domain-containing protein [Motiliproteus sp.]
MGTERRGIGRVRVVWKATLTRLNGEQLPGSTDNVSVDGVNVIVAKPLLVGESVRIDIISICPQGTCYFRLQGVAVYSRMLDLNLGSAVGLRLIDPVDSYARLVGSLADAVDVA